MPIFDNILERIISIILLHFVTVNQLLITFNIPLCPPPPNPANLTPYVPIPTSMDPFPQTPRGNPNTSSQLARQARTKHVVSLIQCCLYDSNVDWFHCDMHTSHGYH